ncbi:MAG: response regulator [Ignavibacteriae bacterium]|nr:response regulator [Ignavibacteriota bacterium]
MENKKYCILILEDDKDVRDSLKEILQLNNYQVMVAENVKEALSTLEKVKPDLILSDIVMPELSGLEFLEKIRTIPVLFNIPFIFLTAQSESNKIREGMNLGADDFITKPFKVNDLLRSVKLRLEKKTFLDEKIDLTLKGITKYVPHELRTPLVAILGYPQLIKENFDEYDKPQIFEMLDNIYHGSKRLLNTLEKFIIYSDITSNKISEEHHEDSLTNNLENLVANVFEQIILTNERKNNFCKLIEESILEINCVHLSTIIKQLLENAFKFSEEGEQVTIIGKINNDKYLFEIIDKGIGFPKEFIHKIGPFVQFNRENNQQLGNGLGLAIANSLLEQFNSKIKIEENIDKGTKVSFELKIAK